MTDIPVSNRAATSRNMPTLDDNIIKNGNKK